MSCKHKNTYWTSWSTIHGVTGDIEYRDKECRDCGKRVDRDTRSGRKYDNER